MMILEEDICKNWNMEKRVIGIRFSFVSLQLLTKRAIVGLCFWYAFLINSRRYAIL